MLNHRTYAAVVVAAALTVGVGAATLLAGASSAHNGGAGSMPRGYVTWEQAVEMKLPVVAQFTRRSGRPACPTPLRLAGHAMPTEPDSDAPVCFAPPEAQGLLIEWPERPSEFPIDEAAAKELSARLRATHAR